MKTLTECATRIVESYTETGKAMAPHALWKPEDSSDSAVRLAVHFLAMNTPPSEVAIEIAARVWCDHEMGNITMDQEAAMEIASIIQRVRTEQAEKHL